MNYYIFQVNSEKFDTEGYLEAAADSDQNIRWLVTKYQNDMQIGDRVFLWRSAASAREKAEVAGFARVTSTPQLMPEDELSQAYWLDGDLTGDATRVELELLALNTASRKLVKREWMKEDPILCDLGILHAAIGTNFKVTQEQGKRLYDLTMNTGTPWSKSESTAGLWLYNELRDKPISRGKDSEVARIAVQIGRAVNGAYNKIMNFRAIDPRDSRSGMSGAGKADRQVWEAYYDPASQTLATELLEADYRRLWLWGSTNATPSAEPENAAGMSTEAPDDDTSLKQLVYITRRRGQPKFRKRLLELYDSKCAISGVDIDVVIDAAHIINHSDNGILLRSDLHDLFDAGLLMIGPTDYKICIDQSLSSSEYYRFHEQDLRPRIDGSQPSPKYLSLKNRSGG